MLQDIKLSATFILPGRILVAEKPISKKGKTQEELQQMKEKFYATHKMETITFRCGGKQETIHIFTRKGKPATQKMNMNKSAYDYMISSESYAAANKSLYEWNRMGKTAKITAHLEAIADSLNVKLLYFNILED